MNEGAWEVLIDRIRDSANRPTADQLRVLAAVHEQVCSEVLDVLNIAADGIEESEKEDVEEGDAGVADR
jgi:hypothetical protein